MGLTPEQINWLRSPDSLRYLRLRTAEAKTLLRILEADSFALRQIAREVKISTEGVRLVVRRFEHRGLIEVTPSGQGRQRQYTAKPTPQLLGLFEVFLRPRL